MAMSADTTAMPDITSDSNVEAVRLRSVSKMYGEFRAMAECDLGLAQGEFLTVVGPSGCGKSTMLEIVAGLRSPTTGDVHVYGAKVERPRKKTAIVFQDSSLLPWRTALMNVALPLEAQKVPKSERLERSTAALAQVGMSDFSSKHPHELSGGMRQRVGVARAIACSPDLFLADEPFGALDEQTRLVIGLQFRDIVRRTEAATFFITHSIQEAVLLSDRIVVMGSRPGRLIAEFVVDLPEERSELTAGSPAISELSSEIWRILAPEARQAMATAGG